MLIILFSEEENFSISMIAKSLFLATSLTIKILNPKSAKIANNPVKAKAKLYFPNPSAPKKRATDIIKIKPKIITMTCAAIKTAVFFAIVFI